MARQLSSSSFSLMLAVSSSFATGVVIVCVELLGGSLPRKRGPAVIDLVGRDTCTRQQQRPKLRALYFLPIPTDTTLAN